MSFLQTLRSVKNTITETQFRSIVKTVTYRLGSSALAAGMAILFGASNSSSAAIGIFVLLFGTITYYVNERIWLLTGWDRNAGNDSWKRTLVKTIAYRFVIFFVVVIVGYVAITPSITVALWYGVSQIPAHFALYFLIERFFNIIGWGKKPVAE